MNQIKDIWAARVGGILLGKVIEYRCGRPGTAPAGRATRQHSPANAHVCNPNVTFHHPESLPRFPPFVWGVQARCWRVRAKAYGGTRPRTPFNDDYLARKVWRLTADWFRLKSRGELVPLLQVKLIGDTPPNPLISRALESSVPFTPVCTPV